MKNFQKQRDRVILIIENRQLNWKQVLEELEKGGEFARKVEERFEEMTK